jgi:hypothetical protein
MTRQFTYDAENRQVSATINGNTANYTFDGLGQRVKKVSGGVTTVYVYDAFGNLAAEYSSGTSTSPCGTPTCYLTWDHLGSTRLLTDTGGASGTASSNVQRYDYLPFGGEPLANIDGRTTGMGYLAAPSEMNPRGNEGQANIFRFPGAVTSSRWTGKMGTDRMSGLASYLSPLAPLRIGRDWSLIRMRSRDGGGSKKLRKNGTDSLFPRVRFLRMKLSASEKGVCPYFPRAPVASHVNQSRDSHGAVYWLSGRVLYFLASNTSFAAYRALSAAGKPA